MLQYHSVFFITTSARVVITSGPSHDVSFHQYYPHSVTPSVLPNRVPSHHYHHSVSLHQYYPTVCLSISTKLHCVTPSVLPTLCDPISAAQKGISPSVLSHNMSLHQYNPHSVTPLALTNRISRPHYYHILCHPISTTPPSVTQSLLPHSLSLRLFYYAVCKPHRY